MPRKKQKDKIEKKVTKTRTKTKPVVKETQDKEKPVIAAKQEDGKFVLGIVDSSELKFQQLHENGFVVSVTQGSTDLWFDFDLKTERIKCKINTSHGQPKVFEFTVTQFIQLLSSRKAKFDPEVLH